MTKGRISQQVFLAVALLLGSGPAGAGSTCGPDGLQGSGSIYRICMPDPGDYNGKVVLWAHGFQDAGTPVQIPEDQLHIGNISIPALVNSLGYGFATNSYSKTGLAVRQGMADLIDLVDIYVKQQGTPAKAFLTGASEGGLITALLLEEHPEIFDGGLAACGPVGDFRFEIDYFGNGRAAFEYFFPGLIPGDPFHPSPTLSAEWESFYSENVKPIVLAPENRHTLDQLVRVARLPFDPADYLDTVELSVHDMLRYAVVNLTDAAQTLDGFPFDNTRHVYTGSDNDILLNRLIPRVSADPAALQEMKAHYDTSGMLTNPVITIHTSRDQQVPYLHEVLYNVKTIRTGALLTRHLNIPINRYEHCNFTPGETLFAFSVMLAYVREIGRIDGVGSVLQGGDLARFEELARQFQLPYSVPGSVLRTRPRN